jgi:heat shock protein HtpX
MPKPKVAIARSDMPNAFATGRSERTALVCATTGLLRRLEPQELEGVLAHEMSHVAHRDVAVMTIASFLGVLAGVITRVALFSGLTRNASNAGPFGLLILLIPLVSALVYVIGFLLTRLLSRYRELAADRAAALLTGRPSALASALTKVNGTMARIPTQDLRRAEPYNAFFFVPAFSSKNSLGRLFASHPTLEQRLEQLARISAELTRP